MLIRKIPPSRLIVVGLVFLAVANIGQWYLQRHSGYPESVVDFTSGLLQGLAIGTLLLGVWRQARPKR